MKSSRLTRVTAWLQGRRARLSRSDRVVLAVALVILILVVSAMLFGAGWSGDSNYYNPDYPIGGPGP